METIFKTDKNGNQRYTSIRVQKLKDGTANIIKATGVVDGKESISTTHVPLGYESALKRAKTIWKNLQVPDVMPMLANKWGIYANTPILCISSRVAKVTRVIRPKNGSNTGFQIHSMILS